ncbi:MAG: TetR/AcrR family transcriptional regulator [Campylobacterota bacterium]|nr:TetR/AcrR family transcriptional regulator [Campylobacterota bacterium]
MSKQQKKLDKRKQIAKSTCNLFIEKGFVNISISEIAKVAGIGKGTVYEYFANKEDIVFELMSCLQEDYDPKLKFNLQNSDNTKQKVIYLFDLFLNEDETVKTQKKIYKEFIAVSLNNPSDEIIKYQKIMKDKYTEILLEIFNEAIDKGELIEKSISLVPSVFATIEGFFIINDDKKLIMDYIDSLFKILEKRGN